MEKEWGRLHTDIFRKFFSSSNKELVKQWQYRWCTLSPWLVDSLRACYDRWVESEQAAGIDASRPHDNARWSVENPTVAECRQTVDAWFDARQPWLDKHVASLYVNPCADGDVNEDGKLGIDDVSALIGLLLNAAPEQ